MIYRAVTKTFIDSERSHIIDSKRISHHGLKENLTTLKQRRKDERVETANDFQDWKRVVWWKSFLFRSLARVRVASIFAAYHRNISFKTRCNMTSCTKSSLVVGACVVTRVPLGFQDQAHQCLGRVV